jgi:hypothetical protein
VSLVSHLFVAICLKCGRARTIALVGTDKIKAFRTGTLQANVAFLWRLLIKEEQVAFDGRDEVEQLAMLERMMHPIEESQRVATVAQKQQTTTEVAKSLRPKRKCGQGQDIVGPGRLASISA